MTYVKTIKRICALRNAVTRADAYVVHHDDSEIDFQITGKISALRDSLAAWTSAPESRKDKYLRRKQIRLACKLMGIDYLSVL